MPRNVTASHCSRSSENSVVTASILMHSLVGGVLRRARAASSGEDVQRPGAKPSPISETACWTIRRAGPETRRQARSRAPAWATSMSPSGSRSARRSLATAVRRQGASSALVPIPGDCRSTCPRTRSSSLRTSRPGPSVCLTRSDDLRTGEHSAVKTYDMQARDQLALGRAVRVVREHLSLVSATAGRGTSQVTGRAQPGASTPPSGRGIDPYGLYAGTQLRPVRKCRYAASLSWRIRVSNRTPRRPPLPDPTSGKGR